MATPSIALNRARSKILQRHQHSPLSTRTQIPQIQDITAKDINAPQLDFDIQSKSDNFVSTLELNDFSGINKDSSNNRGDVRIDFSIGADSSVVSEKSLNILRQASIASNNNHIKITSTLRSPAKQAELMYDYNLIKGFVKQYGLYGSIGDQVIRVHEENVGKSKEDILDLMVNKINQLEPSNVSKHCGNHNDVNVFDIYVGNLKNPDLLYNELLKLEGSLINKVIDERDRGCIHVEIKQ